MEKRERHRRTAFETAEKLVGFFDGEIQRIDEEIEEVRLWRDAVRIGGGKIIRRDQLIESLQRLKANLHHVQKYTIDALVELHPELREEFLNGR